jgi:Xaa-Pro aminopeptidase
MITRRSFLSLSASAAGTARVRAVATRRDDNRQTAAAAMPASIARLTSMRGAARPITAGERRGRIERARQLLGDAKLDAVLLSGGTSLVYFTNIRWAGGERLLACLIPKSGEPVFVCPAFEEDRLREQIERGPFDPRHVDVRTWQEDQSPYDLVAQALGDRGLSTGRLGVEETTKFVWADSIAAAAPQLKVVSATPVIAGCRMIKDSHELELMQLASTATLKVYAAVHEAIRPGMTQVDVERLIAVGYRQVGFEGEASVQVGEYTALPHGSLAPQTIREGTIVMIDDGCTVEGYQSDITRTFVLGKATDAMHRVFDAVKRAQAAALAAARPGVALAAIDAAARQVVTEAGYGPGYAHFSHRLGHGLGMDMHEWPYLVENNMFGWERALSARAGMVFSNEPGIYLRGQFGVRLEDDMYITDDGAKLFTTPSTSLEQPF